MENGSVAICTTMPGKWTLGERFKRDRYLWEIVVVCWMGAGSSTVLALRLHLLDSGEFTVGP